VHLPPLRDRREDIPYLAASFIREFAERLKRPIAGITAPAERLLQDAAWPGNIRELRNTIERACILSDGRILTERDFAAAMARRGEAAPAAFGPEAADGAVEMPEGDAALLSTAQREQIKKALQDTHGNKAAAARKLGVSRRSLYRWIERLDLDA
jgi:DNA-binding NtrC family response regulator